MPDNKAPHPIPMQSLSENKDIVMFPAHLLNKEKYGLTKQAAFLYGYFLYQLNKSKDERGLYVTLPIKEMCQLFYCSTTSAALSLKLLKQEGYIKSRRVGYGTPIRYYLEWEEWYE